MDLKCTIQRSPVPRSKAFPALALHILEDYTTGLSATAIMDFAGVYTRALQTCRHKWLAAGGDGG